MMMRRVFLAVVVATGATGSGLNAQVVTKPAPARPAAARTPAATTAPAAAPASRDDDEKAIEAVVDAFIKAFNAGDAEAAAATFAEDALVVVEEGERVEGRGAIRDQLAASFADNPGSTIAIQTDALRFLGPDTALEEGGTTITPAGGGRPSTPGSRPSMSGTTAVGSSRRSATRIRGRSRPTTASRSWSGWSANGSTRARTRWCTPPATGPRMATSWSESSP